MLVYDAINIFLLAPRAVIPRDDGTPLRGGSGLGVPLQSKTETTVSPLSYSLFDSTGSSPSLTFSLGSGLSISQWLAIKKAIFRRKGIGKLRVTHILNNDI